ncbi:hypothetical protein H0H81_005289 [Sphagnurus paluster]|uniref:Protein kinase domain-containing protein n=1 Tax=Sphagnurus paluster TaxID=117069 RepID=A0A9P7K5L7_9AGAR|nr:hypothetical protein H0H81_005289 [Sphagnurus paluster]
MKGHSGNGNVNVESERDPRRKYDLTSFIICSLLTQTTFGTDFVILNLAVWTPWINEAILILRVVAVFKPTLYSRFSNMVALLAFPVILKIVRATILIYNLVKWRRENSITSTNYNVGPYADEYWVLESTTILEMVDNGLVSLVSPVMSRALHSPYLVMDLNNIGLDRYISALFLWRLAVHAKAISGFGDREGPKTGIFRQSNLIDVPRCKAPAYGKIHIGLFLAITQDAIDRIGQQCKEAHKSKKRRRSATALTSNKRPRTRVAIAQERREDDEQRENIEAMKKECPSRSLAMIELRYDVYNSPALSSFVRFNHPEKTSYGPQEYLSIVLTSQIAAGATGIAHEGQLKLLASDEKVRSVKVVVKLAFGAEQNERLRHEFDIYEHLVAGGVAGGIPIIYGLFEDVESDAVALGVMTHVGNSLWSLKPDKKDPESKAHIPEPAKAAFLRALSAIHKAGVRHRDIRPENLTLVDDDLVAIIDLDMAEINPSESATKTREMRSYVPPNEFPSSETTPETIYRFKVPRRRRL